MGNFFDDPFFFKIEFFAIYTKYTEKNVLTFNFTFHDMNSMKVEENL